MHIVFKISSLILIFFDILIFLFLTLFSYMIITYSLWIGAVLRKMVSLGDSKIRDASNVIGVGVLEQGENVKFVIL